MSTSNATPAPNAGATPEVAGQPLPETTTERPTAGTPQPPVPPVEEIGGPPGPEPTRYGDWQIKGRVSDF
jgi:hypothetical protein